MTGRRLIAIDLLRGVAVLAVLGSHLPFSWSSTLTREGTVVASAFPPLVAQISDFGHFGVSLFLVISGFCIHLRWARRPGPQVGFFAFWRRRLTRLYPPYFFALIASVLGLFFAFGILARATTPAGMFGYASLDQLRSDVLSHVLLIQNVNESSQRIGNGPFWTLALEEQLYLLYFVLLFSRRLFGWGFTLFTVAAVTFMWRALPLFGPLPPSWPAIGPSRWIEWTLGAVAVEAYAGLIHLPGWTRSWRIAVLATAAAVIVNLTPLAAIFGDAAFGGAFFLWLNVLVASEVAARLSGRVVRALAAVGLFSYSLYLTQEPVIVATKQLALRLGLAAGAWQTVVMVVARFGVAIVVGYIFYRLAERPFIVLSRRIRTEQQPHLSLTG